MRDPAPLLGGIELGGTKCVCLIGTGPEDIRMRSAVPTGADAAATLRHLEEELRRGIAAHGPIRALGIASFGPVDLDRNSPTYGWITSTPKPGWRRTPVTARFRELDLPLGFDTDVNGAALAEGRWGAARETAHLLRRLGGGRQDLCDAGRRGKTPQRGLRRAGRRGRDPRPGGNRGPARGAGDLAGEGGVLSR